MEHEKKNKYCSLETKNSPIGINQCYLDVGENDELGDVYFKLEKDIINYVENELKSGNYIDYEDLLCKMEEVLKFYEKSNERVKPNEKFYFYLAFLYFKNNKFQQAKEQLQNHNKLTKTKNVDLVFMGDIYRALNDFQLAEVYYNKAYSKNFSSYEMNKLLSTFYISNEKWNEAHKILKKMFNHNKLNDYIIYNYMWTYAQNTKLIKTSGVVGDIINVLKKNKFKDDTGLVELYLGIVCSKRAWSSMGWAHLGIKYLNKAMEKGFIAIGNSYISICYFHLEFIKKATKYGEKAVSLNPIDKNIKIRYDKMLEISKKNWFRRHVTQNIKYSRIFYKLPCERYHDFEDIKKLNIYIENGYENRRI